ncbi:MAG: type II toxin-antitoxin system VapC family toxin [Promicromonosporaceae bacterium]|nr:type II toxin-antitoxin system VapC family toxin [Promicromonosporaceae bacterium]
MIAYLDTSAAAKFVQIEPESAALSFWEEVTDVVLVSSDLLVTELGRLQTRHDLNPEGVAAVISGMHIVPVTRLDYHAAAQLPGKTLRSLDALHMRMAISTGAEVVVTYDNAMIEAARALGLRVIHPGKE